MVAALVLSLLSQTPTPAGAASPSKEFAVLVSRRVGGVSEVRATALARKVVEILKEQGFDKVQDPSQSAKALAVLGVKDSAECDGKRECVSGLGRVLRVWGVVAMDLADIDGTMAIHFEALESDKGEKLALHDVALPTKKVEVELGKALLPLVQALRAAADAAGYEVKPLPDDVPAVVKLTPSETPAVAEAPPMSKAHVGALVTTGAAVVGAALVILFLAQAGTAQRQLDGARVDRVGGGVGYNLPEGQARTLATRVNDNDSAALGAGLGTAGVAVLSGVLWALP